MLRFIMRRRLRDRITCFQDKIGSFCTKKHFDKILERERARSDRNGYHFTLIDFDINVNEYSRNILHRLERCLLIRLRKTDEVGWLENNHVGVLLFNTGELNGHLFANQIRQSALEFGLSLKYKVFEYPDKRFSEGDFSRKRLSVGWFASKSEKELGEGFGAKIKTLNEFAINDHYQKQSFLYPILFKRELPFWKRCIDVLGAAISLILFSPVFVLTAGFIKLLSPRGSVFFKQKRIGLGGKPFIMWKFRTMHMDVDHKDHECYLNELICGGDVENSGIKPMKKLENACDIIPFCSVLRKLAIDELPQLINVLIGDMSLVGPRPPIPYEVKNYKPWHTGRLDVVPGMTGLWQVSGKNRLSFTEMVRLDIRYIRKMSLLSDLKIIFKTPLCILSQLGDSH